MREHLEIAKKQGVDRDKWDMVDYVSHLKKQAAENALDENDRMAWFLLESIPKGALSVLNILGNAA